VQFWKTSPLCLALLGLLLATACGGGEGDAASRSTSLTSSEASFQVEFRGAEPTDKEVRLPPTLEVSAAPPGTSWWGFELYVKNVGDAPAATPDVGVACDDAPTSAAEFFNDPGFVVGEPPYVRGTGAGGQLDAGASSTGVVPLAVPNNASECRFLLRMDESSSAATAPLEFSFDASE
jgi:hypothetical protein